MRQLWAYKLSELYGDKLFKCDLQTDYVGSMTNFDKFIY